MSVKVSLSIGEDYPHLFVTDDAGEIRYRESAEGSKHGTVVELSDEDWAGYRQAAGRYYEWVEKLDELRKQAGGRNYSLWHEGDGPHPGRRPRYPERARRGGVPGPAEPHRADRGGGGQGLVVDQSPVDRVGERRVRD